MLVKVQLEADPTGWTYISDYLPIYLSISMYLFLGSDLSKLWKLLLCAFQGSHARASWLQRSLGRKRCTCKLKGASVSWNPGAHTGTRRADENVPLALPMQASCWRSWCPLHIAKRTPGPSVGEAEGGSWERVEHSQTCCCLHWGGHLARKHPDSCYLSFMAFQNATVPAPTKIIPEEELWETAQPSKLANYKMAS